VPMLVLDIELLKINHFRPRTLAGSLPVVTNLSMLVTYLPFSSNRRRTFDQWSQDLYRG
jgi:hypothetical protein